MAYSLEQLNAADEFTTLVEQLESAVGDLRHMLAQGDAIQGRVFALPRVTREDEENPIDFIDPTVIDGPDAFDKGLAALADWYGVPGYSTKAVHRLPGALAFQVEDPEVVQAAISRCNQLKQAIKALVPRLGNRDDRFELIHRRHHMLILLQLTRYITALTCPPMIRSVTFTWGFKTEIYKLSLDEACKVLAGLRKRSVPRGEDAMSWVKRVDREIVNLRSLPSGVELRHRRPLKVRPLVNVRYILTEQEKIAREQALARGERVNQPVKLYEGHTPLIILNPPPAMSIGNLGSFCAETRRKRAPRKGLKTGPHPITGLGSIYIVENSEAAGDKD